MRHDIPGPVHAHVNAMMLRAINDADHTALAYKPPHTPRDRPEAARTVSAFIEIAYTDLRHRWYNQGFFIAVSPSQ